MRQIAKHVYIKELLDGDYEEKEGWDPNILHTARGPVSRVNIIGTILSLGGQTVLDDGSGQVTLRAFEEVPGLKDAKVGQASLVIGRPRYYQESLLIIPEVVRPVDPRWAAVRKLELGDVGSYTKKQLPKKAVVAEIEGEFDNNADKMIAAIAELDDGDGAAIDDVIEKSGLGDIAEGIIQQLLLDGEIFEIKPGVVKVL